MSSWDHSYLKEKIDGAIRTKEKTMGFHIVMGYMIAGLAIFMACFSAITNAFDVVFSEEADPNVDPLAEFQKVKEERKEIEQLSKDTGSVEAEEAEKEAANAEN